MGLSKFVGNLHVVLVYPTLEVLINMFFAPFRFMNREVLEPMWNQDHIERVEVVLKETVTCEGK